MEVVERVLGWPEEQTLPALEGGLEAGSRHAELAEALTISPRTVDVHLTSVFAKTGSANRAAATAFALRHGLA